MPLAHPPLSPSAPLLPDSPLRQLAPPVRADPQVPRLSVVIVNYCQWQETAQLTRQILASPEGRQEAVEVVIVDNHSPRHRLASRLRRWPGVSFRRWKRNRGFARAVNEGHRLSRGHWLLLLNPDITLSDGFLAGVLALMDRLPREDPSIGIVGFHLHNDDGTGQRSVGPFPTLAGTLTRLLLPRARRKYSSPRLDQPSQVPWATGCCLLLRRECLAQLGGLDEDFFLYYEDVDLCRRAKDQGWAVRYEPGLRAIHHRPLHGRKVSAPLRVFTRHALLVYGAKHWPRWQFQALAGLIYLEAWERHCWALVRGQEENAAQFQELRAITWELLKGRGAAARRRLERVAQGPLTFCARVASSCGGHETETGRRLEPDKIGAQPNQME
jgi:GT2 family glycosyltransferase